MPDPPDDKHFNRVVNAAKDGKLTVFLGAGANYAQRGNNHDPFDENSDFLPMGSELSRYLAKTLNFRLPDHIRKGLDEDCASSPCSSLSGVKSALRDTYLDDLGRVSQQAQLFDDSALREELHRIFSRTYEPTELHRKLAQCSSASEVDRRPVFITTNYDTMMEQSLADAGEPFDVIYYRPPGPGQATNIWLYHWKNAENFYNGTDLTPNRDDLERPIIDLAAESDLPLGSDNSRDEVQPNERARSLVIKLHGTVSPLGWEESSFIISPDDYIQFLRQVSLQTPLPSVLVERLVSTHFLFLGYGLGDWNILAICQNLWEQRKVNTYGNWAVQKSPSDLDEQRWNNSGVFKIGLFDQDLAEYADNLRDKFL